MSPEKCRELEQLSLFEFEEEVRVIKVEGFEVDTISSSIKSFGVNSHPPAVYSNGRIRGTAVLLNSWWTRRFRLELLLEIKTVIVFLVSRLGPTFTLLLRSRTSISSCSMSQTQNSKLNGVHNVEEWDK